MLWTEFPTELPVAKLSLLLDVWRGAAIDPADAALAALNVVGYAAGNGLVKTAAVFGATPVDVSAAPAPDASEVEAAFGAVLARPMAAGPASADGTPNIHGGGTAAPATAAMFVAAPTEATKIPWATILGIAIPILRKFILGF